MCQKSFRLHIPGNCSIEQGNSVENPEQDFSSQPIKVSNRAWQSPLQITRVTALVLTTFRLHVLNFKGNEERD